MEHVAEITFRARMLGPVRPLAREQVERLREVGRGLGLPERKILPSPCDHCNACPGDRSPAPVPLGREPAAPAAETLASQTDVNAMVRRVTETVEQALRRR